MSSAFDTIDRHALLETLKIILEEDEMRMCHLLLSKTMKLRFGNHKEETFITNKGAPQGDAITGIFFTIAFEKALRQLRE